MNHTIDPRVYELALSYVQDWHGAIGMAQARLCMEARATRLATAIQQLIDDEQAWELRLSTRRLRREKEQING